MAEVWSHSGVWSLKSGGLESGVSGMESGVWSHFGVWIWSLVSLPESGVQSLESLCSLVC